MDGALAGLELLQFAGIDLHHGHLVPGVGKRRACGEAYITGPDDDDVHPVHDGTSSRRGV